jgi:hypothetical protein
VNGLCNRYATVFLNFIWAMQGERRVSPLDQAPKTVLACMNHCENATRGKEFSSISICNLAVAFPHDPTARPRIAIFIINKQLQQDLPITVAARSKVWTVFARSNTGIVGSNPKQGMDYLSAFILFVLPCVGSGLATGILPTVLERNWSETKRFSDALCSRGSKRNMNDE